MKRITRSYRDEKPVAATIAWLASASTIPPNKSISICCLVVSVETQTAAARIREMILYQSGMRGLLLTAITANQLVRQCMDGNRLSAASV